MLYEVITRLRGLKKVGSPKRCNQMPGRRRKSDFLKPFRGWDWKSFRLQSRSIQHRTESPSMWKFHYPRSGSPHRPGPASRDKAFFPIWLAQFPIPTSHWPGGHNRPAESFSQKPPVRLTGLWRWWFFQHLV